MSNNATMSDYVAKRGSIGSFDKEASKQVIRDLGILKDVYPFKYRRLLAKLLPAEPLTSILKDVIGFDGPSELAATGSTGQSFYVIQILGSLEGGRDMLRAMDVARLAESGGKEEEAPAPKEEAPTPKVLTEAPKDPLAVQPAEPAMTAAEAKLQALQDILGLGAPKASALSDDEKTALKKEVRDEVVKEFGSNGGNVCRIEIFDRKTGEEKDLGIAHCGMPLLMAAVRAGVNVALPGDAGSGKTFAALQVAKALGRDFTAISCNPVMTPGQVIGRPTADGGFVDGPLVHAMRTGHLFLADEFDKMRGDLAPMFNSTMANRFIGLPSGEMLNAHTDTVFIAAMNTYGTGATDMYASQRQDSATMDRLFFIRWEYDPALEAAMIGIKTRVKGPDYSVDRGGILGTKEAWFRFILKVRELIGKNNIKHVVSPRATLMGVQLAEQGIGIHWLVEGLILKGLKAQQREKIMKGADAHLQALTS